MNISNRLKKIASFVKEDAYILDVGCDHALLDIYLAKNKENIKIIASDINEGPLNQAKKNLEKYDVTNKITLALADGLESINNDVDTVIISGMGTSTILEILKKDKLENVKQLIISSNNNYELLRKNIVKLGFIIDKEEIVYENKKYYPIISFIKGNKKYKRIELKEGPILIKEKDDIYKKYITNKIEKNKNILSKLNSNHIIKKIIIKKEIRDLNKIL